MFRSKVGIDDGKIRNAVLRMTSVQIRVAFDCRNRHTRIDHTILTCIVFISSDSSSVESMFGTHCSIYRSQLFQVDPCKLVQSSILTAVFFRCSAQVCKNQSSYIFSIHKKNNCGSPRRLNHSALQLILLLYLPSPRISFTLNSKLFSLNNPFLLNLVCTNSCRFSGSLT